MLTRVGPATYGGQLKSQSINLGLAMVGAAVAETALPGAGVLTTLLGMAAGGSLGTGYTLYEQARERAERGHWIRLYSIFDAS